MVEKEVGVLGMDKQEIQAAVLNLFQTNMGVRPGERVLVITDVATAEQWRERDLEFLTCMLNRSLLAKAVAEIAGENLKGCRVDFTTYDAVGKSGTEPPAEAGQTMRGAEVVIAITTFSLSHTAARQEACRAGARIASMPGVLPETFAPGGPLSADYRLIAEDTHRMARLLSEARTAALRSPAGTDLRFCLEGREAIADTGLYVEPGQWGNLPAGEAYIAPVEGSCEGRLVVEAGWYPGLTSNLALIFHAGEVCAIEGGGEVGQELADLLELGSPSSPHRQRRNAAELGVGTNAQARWTEKPALEVEKIRGTAHVAIGDNAHMGGRVNVDIHYDFIVPQTELVLDGRAVLRAGEVVL